MLNVRCVSVSKFNSLVIDAQTFDVDFLCLTETWFTSNSVNSFHHYIYKFNTTILLVGDFNLDSSNDSPEYKRLSCILNNFNLTSRVKWPTRVTYHTSSTIDHIFSNCPDDAVTCVLDNDISDHRTILFDYCSGSSDNVPNITLRRSFDNQSLQLFSTDMMQENWSNLYQINDVSLAYAAFFNTFMHYFNKHFPKKRRSTQNKKQNRWSNSNIVRSSNNLKDLYCLKMCYPELEDIYKKAKTNHKRLISFTKKLYYQDKISLSDNPVKAAWNTIHELSNKPKRGGNNISISHNNIIIDGKKDVAEHFNEYFYNSPINISNSIGYIPSQGRDNKSLSNTNHVSQTLFLFPYTQAELINILYRKMKNKFSCGFDEVPMYLVKQVLHIIIDPITHLVNLSFTNGTFPDSLKVGKLIPTHKKGDIQCVENYRPIVMPSAFSKTFEYAFLHRLSGYIQKNNVISQNQHGFRENKSTDTAIHSFYGPLVKHMENGECPVGIFCDLTKAFDCVNHMILLDKLSNYGIRGNALKWISSFLEDRRQFVSVNGVSSEYKTITMGVAQGSVLGPFLFLLYINDLDNLSVPATYTMYADDTSILISDKQESVIAQKCNYTIHCSHDWFERNGLQLNASKTMALRFHNRQKECDNLTLNLGKSTIVTNMFDSVKFLGMYLDPCLSWKSHCQSLIGKLHSTAFLMNNLRPVLRLDHLLMVYHARVGSRLRYGVCLWGMSTLSHDVFLAQKRVIRCMMGLPRSESCKNIFKKLTILPFPCLFILEMCVYVFKNIDKFNTISDIHCRNTRQKNDLFVPYRKYRIGSNAPDCLGVKLYNSLPASSKSSHNLNFFMKSVKTFLLENCFYSVQEFLGR
nr:unnamed protein product [Callosobruchus analis]